MHTSHDLIYQPWVVTSCGELLNSPRHGSFFTRNSSRAIQPPPTRTITVLRKIRTRRSCWESPNYGRRGRKTERGHVKTLTCVWTLVLTAVQHWKPDWSGQSHLFQFTSFTFSLIYLYIHIYCGIRKFNQNISVQKSNIHQRYFVSTSVLIYSLWCTNEHKQDYDTKIYIFSFHSQRHKLHKCQSNWVSSSSLC